MNFTKVAQTLINLPYKVAQTAWGGGEKKEEKERPLF